MRDKFAILIEQKRIKYFNLQKLCNILITTNAKFFNLVLLMIRISQNLKFYFVICHEEKKNVSKPEINTYFNMEKQHQSSTRVWGDWIDIPLFHETIYLRIRHQQTTNSPFCQTVTLLHPGSVKLKQAI